MIDVIEFIKARLLYRSNQRLSRPEFERRRLVRFREFAAFVKTNSPYYRRIMEERAIDPAHCAPGDFPILTKTDVIKNFNDIVAVRGLTYKNASDFLLENSPPGTRLQNRYVIVHTSGSSGEVGIFPYDSKAWARAIAGLSRAKGFDFFTARRKKIAFMGATKGHFAGVTSAHAVNEFPLNLVYELRTFEINRPLREAIAGLNVYKPDIVVGYASALKALAEKQLERELKIAPEVLTNSGEPLLGADKQVIEQAFGKRVRNFYTCSEHMFMGLREPWQEAMYLFEDELFFEIEVDHIAVTNLSNRVLPLIRYRMTDILLPLDRTVQSPYRSIAEVAGRLESLAKFKNASGSIEALSSHAVAQILVPHVRHYQMRLRSLESFDLAVVLQSGINEDQKREALAIADSQLRAILADKAMENVTFEIPIVDMIAVDPKTGKFRMIVNAEIAAS